MSNQRWKIQSNPGIFETLTVSIQENRVFGVRSPPRKIK